MDHHRIKSFIENLFSAKQLRIGIDFEVVSFMVLKDEFNFESVDCFLAVDSNKLLQIMNDDPHELNDYFLKQPKIQEVIGLTTTPYPDSKENNINFYKMKGNIHFDYAISLGFGVVKMLKGRYKGEYLLYNYQGFIEDEHDALVNAIEEMLMLKIYIQLTYPTKEHDKRLETFF